MSTSNGIKFFAGKLPSFSAIGYFARKIKTRPFLPDYSGQTWLITGASDGIGAAMAQEAALAGARVITVARSQDKMMALKKFVASYRSFELGPSRYGKSIGSILTAPADLSSMGDIQQLVETLQRKVKIDVLINNVGILNNQHRASPDGFEQSYAVNLLGQYFLTELIFHKNVFARSPLIINMSSGGLYNVGLNARFLNQPAKNFDGMLAYASHKRAQITLTDHWRRSSMGEERFVYTMHPGWVRTSGVATSLPEFSKTLGAILRTPMQGGETALWLAQRRPGTGENVIWFDRKQRPAHIYRHTRMPEITGEELIDRLDFHLKKINMYPL